MLKRRPIRVKRRAVRRQYIKTHAPKVFNSAYRKKWKSNLTSRGKRVYRKTEKFLGKSSKYLSSGSTILATTGAYARKYGMSGKRLTKVENAFNKAREFIPNSLDEVIGKNGLFGTYNGPGSATVKQIVKEGSTVLGDIAEFTAPIVEDVGALAPLLLV